MGTSIVLYLKLLAVAILAMCIAFVRFSLFKKKDFTDELKDILEKEGFKLLKIEPPISDSDNPFPFIQINRPIYTRFGGGVSTYKILHIEKINTKNKKQVWAKISTSHLSSPNIEIRPSLHEL